jgi:hypothetical protein
MTLRWVHALFAAAMLPLAGAAVPAMAQETRGSLDIDTRGVESILVSGDFLDITIRGTTGVFEGRWRSKQRSGAARAPAPAIEAIVSDGKLILSAAGATHDYRLELAIPAAWNVRAEVFRHGAISVSGVAGEVSAWAAEGPIKLTGQRGPFSVTAMGGAADVQFSGRTLAGPSAISALAPGPSDVAIRLRLAPTLAASLRVAAAGTVTWDVPGARKTARPRGTTDLNGGGEAIALRSATGQILVTTAQRKGKP